MAILEFHERAIHRAAREDTAGLRFHSRKSTPIAWRLQDEYKCIRATPAQGSRSQPPGLPRDVSGRPKKRIEDQMANTQAQGSYSANVVSSVVAAISGASTPSAGADTANPAAPDSSNLSPQQITKNATASK
jgi:hypothetical protein